MVVAAVGVVEVVVEQVDVEDAGVEARAVGGWCS